MKYKELANFIKKEPQDLQLILLYRNVQEELFEPADLVTEMREIKHYYTNDVPARDVIEF